MSASTGTTSPGSVYTTPAFWERLWRTAGIQSVLCFIVAYIVYGHQPQVGASADALAAFYGGAGTRILIAAVFYGLAVLNLMWFAAAIKHLGGCGARRLGRGGDRLQCRRRSAFPLAHRGGHSPCVLERRVRKSNVYIGPERLRMGRLRVDFVPARDAYHGRSVWALAGPADFERALRGRGRCCSPRLARWHHLADRRILGTGRRLFALHIAGHRPGVGPGREWGALDSKPCYPGWMVIPDRPDRGRERLFECANDEDSEGGGHSEWLAVYLL